MNNSDRLRYSNIRSLKELRMEKRILAHRIEEKQVRFENLYLSVKSAINSVSNLISSFVVSVTLVKTFWVDIKNTLSNGSELLNKIRSIFSGKKKKKEDNLGSDEKID